MKLTLSIFAVILLAPLSVLNAADLKVGAVFSDRILLSILASLTFAAWSTRAAETTFKKIQLSDKFWSEGAHFGDFNHDRKMDVVSGPYWYEGPDFQKRHEYRPATNTFKRKKDDGTEVTIEGFEGALGTKNGYSDNFLTFTCDFNGDGLTDVITCLDPHKYGLVWWEQTRQEARSGSSSI